ncbi:TPA: hypothetical protein DCZ77_00950 [Patescibacteria group bacterium]|nr:hypothetical protein [Patescibacteria group bacterium]
MDNINNNNVTGNTGDDFNQGTGSLNTPLPSTQSNDYNAVQPSVSPLMDGVLGGSAPSTPPMDTTFTPTPQVEESTPSMDTTFASAPVTESTPNMDTTFASAPVVESTPSMDTSFTPAPVVESTPTPVAEETPVVEEVAPVADAFKSETPANLSQPFAAYSTTPDIAVPKVEEEVVNTLDSGEEKKEKGGGVVVVVLIVIIVALLATIGYFGYQIFIK